jgi:hypothetical protein
MGYPGPHRGTAVQLHLQTGEVTGSSLGQNSLRCRGVANPVEELAKYRFPDTQ